MHLTSESSSHPPLIDTLPRPLKARSFGGRVRRLCSLLQFSKTIQWHPGAASLLALLRGCVRDLRTGLYRMGQRIDTLPSVYLPSLGPAIERLPNGSLQPCTRTLSCTKDIRSFEALHPEATEFDIEIFSLGWQQGAQWGAGSICTSNRQETA